MRARTRNAMGSGTLLAPRAAAASRGTSRRLYLGNATAAVHSGDGTSAPALPGWCTLFFIRTDRMCVLVCVCARVRFYSGLTHLGP